MTIDDCLGWVILVLLSLGPLSSIEQWRRVFWLLESPEDQAITPEEIGPPGCWLGLWGWGVSFAALGILFFLMGVQP